MSKVSQVKVSTFSRCTTKDLRDYVKPILRKKPDRLIIHIGTNSLRESSSPTACAQEIIELARSAKNSSPDTDIIISNLRATLPYHCVRGSTRSKKWTSRYFVQK